MKNTVISVEHLTKQYDLGVIGTGTLSRDLERWWARTRGKPDPYAIIGRSQKPSGKNESILALDDVSFTVQQGEALGIIGRNGAGKSTLLKILSRVTAPTSGVVKVRGRIGSLLEVGTGFHPELTGRENVYLNGAILGMRKAEVSRKFDEIVAFSGVERFIDTPVKRYSSGMYVRLAFAVAAHLDPEILIVDEVLAVGDAEFQKKCLGKMSDVASEGRTVLFVSHNMGSISELCEKTIFLANGTVEEIGPTSAMIESYLKSGISYNKKVNSSDEINRNYVGPYEIRSVWLENSEGEECYLFRHYDDLVFCMKYHSESNPVVVGVSVRDMYNQPLIYLSNINDRVQLETELDESVVRVTFSRNLLRGGEYSVSFSLNTGTNVHCDLWKDVIRLHVNDTDLGQYLALSPVISEGVWSVSRD